MVPDGSMEQGPVTVRCPSVFSLIFRYAYGGGPFVRSSPGSEAGIALVLTSAERPIFSVPLLSLDEFFNSSTRA